MSRRNTLLNIETFTQGNDIADDVADESGWNPFEPQPKVWGDIQPLTGREFIQAQQAESTVSHKIETEFIKDVNNRMRLVEKAVDAEGEASIFRTYNVESVVDVKNQHRKLEWMCLEVV